MTDEEEERVTPIPHTQAKVAKIAELIDHDGLVHKAEEKSEKARSDLGNLYQKMEKDFHGNRKAIKAIRTLIKGSTDAAYDYMRTFLPLAHQFGLVPNDDLSDKAGGGTNPDGTTGTIDSNVAKFPSKLDEVKDSTAAHAKPKFGDPMPKFVGSKGEIDEQKKAWKIQQQRLADEAEFDEKMPTFTGSPKEAAEKREQWIADQRAKRDGDRDLAGDANDEGEKPLEPSPPAPVESSSAAGETLQ